MFIKMLIHYSLFTVHYSLFTVHYSLFTIHCSLFTVHYSLFTFQNSCSNVMPSPQPRLTLSPNSNRGCCMSGSP